MRVRIQNVDAGLHPSEVTVSLRTSDGLERIVVDKRSIVRNSIAIGSPVACKGDLLLIELPRETTTGAWRVWVRKSSVVPEVRAA